MFESWGAGAWLVGFLVAQRLAELRGMRIPRLLVVADGDGELPLPVDCLEDWVTSGAPEWEVDARRRARSRARRER